MDAFTIGFRIPNLFRRVFGEGAFTAAFLPEFVQQRESSETQNAWELAVATFLLLSGLLALLVVLVCLALGICLACFEWSAETTLLLQLTILMFPYVLLVCQMALLVAILQAEQRFAISALMPILLNAIWIVALATAPLIASDAQRQLVVVSGSIVLAGVVQVCFPVLYFRQQGIRWPSKWMQKWPDAKRLFWGMSPVIAGVMLTQFNTVFDSLLAWWFAFPQHGGLVDQGTASALYYAQRLFQFPLGVFGVALASVLFPLLSKAVARKQEQEVAQLLCRGLILSAGLGIPASLGLWILAEPVTSLLFERGAFDQNDVYSTAVLIRVYATSVWVLITLGILNRTFYADGNRMTPMWWAIGGAITNVVLDFVLLPTMGAVGLVWASVAASVVQLAGSFGSLPQMRSVSLKQWIPQCLWIGCASLVMALVMYFTMQPMTGLGNRFAIQCQQVMLPILLGIGSYYLMIKWLNVQEVLSLLKRTSDQAE